MHLGSEEATLPRFLKSKNSAVSAQTPDMLRRAGERIDWGSILHCDNNPAIYTLGGYFTASDLVTGKPGSAVGFYLCFVDDADAC